MSVNKYKLKHRVKNNEAAALKVEYLLSNTDKTLGLILLLNNFVNILASAITTLIAIELYGDKGVAIGAGVLTFLIWFSLKLHPKPLRLNHADAIAYKISFILLCFEDIFSNCLFINFFSKFILKLFGVNKKVKLWITYLMKR